MKNPFLGLVLCSRGIFQVNVVKFSIGLYVIQHFLPIGNEFSEWYQGKSMKERIYYLNFISISFLIFFPGLQVKKNSIYNI